MSRDQRPARPAVISSGGDLSARRRDDDVAAAASPTVVAPPTKPARKGGIMKAVLLLIAALAGGAGYVMLAPGARGADFAPFAPRLANMPMPAGPDLWTATMPASDQQAQRWNKARGAIARGRGAEAVGWLDLMAREEPDLALVSAFRLANGAANALNRRNAEARRALSDPALLRHSEACAWHMLAGGDDALCAEKAVAARTGNAALPFRITAARRLIDGGEPAEALRWLVPLSENSPAANLWRGRGLLAVAQKAGDPERRSYWQRRAVLRFARAEALGHGETLHASRLELALAQLQLGRITPANAQQTIDDVAYRWRGGPLDWRATSEAARIAALRNQPDDWLRLSASRLRYGPANAQAKPLRSAVAAWLVALPASDQQPLAQMAGTIWRYRDLLPADADGIAAYEALVLRLETAGLNGKAADLLDWRRRLAPSDIERGPLSLRIARNHLLADAPAKALTILRADARIAFPDAIMTERTRLEAIALWRSGAKDAALGLLADGDGGSALAAEMLWQNRDWSGWLTADRRNGSAAGEARLIRRAIALSMTGDEAALAALYKSSRGRFAVGQARDAFDLLAGPDAPDDPDVLRRALAKLPVPDLPGDSAALLTPR